MNNSWPKFIKNRSVSHFETFCFIELIEVLRQSTSHKLLYEDGELCKWNLWYKSKHLTKRGQLGVPITRITLGFEKFTCSFTCSYYCSKLKLRLYERQNGHITTYKKLRFTKWRWWRVWHKSISSSQGTPLRGLFFQCVKKSTIDSAIRTKCYVRILQKFVAYHMGVYN